MSTIPEHMADTTDRIPRTATSVLLSDEERRTLRVAAAHLDMTLSTYLRVSALDRAARETVEVT